MKGHGTKPESHGAILVVAMGTTQKDGRSVVEEFMELAKEAYPKADVDFAFNHESVRLLLKESGEEVLSPLAAITKLLDKGHSQIVVQPLYFTLGKRYHELYRIVSALNDLAGPHGAVGFDGILIGKPLLRDTEDYFEVADLINIIFGDSLEEDEAIVFVAPTSEGVADTSLCQLQMAMDEFCDSGKIIIGGIGGYPGVKWALNRLGDVGAKKVSLVPLSLVTGIHAWLEISGEENENSWKTVLESEGYSVSVANAALGGFVEINEIFVRGLQETADSHGFLK